LHLLCADLLVAVTIYVIEFAQKALHASVACLRFATRDAAADELAGGRSAKNRESGASA
jgi:hypothetical protein